MPIYERSFINRVWVQIKTYHSNVHIFASPIDIVNNLVTHGKTLQNLTIELHSEFIAWENKVHSFLKHVFGQGMGHGVQFAEMVGLNGCPPFSKFFVHLEHKPHCSNLLDPLASLIAVMRSVLQGM